MFKILCLTALVAMTLPAPVAHANDFLGERLVAYNSETDVIPVPGAERYRSVRLFVKVHAVRFTDVDVIFANGGGQDIKMRKIIGPGDCTRWINLRGPRRDIRRIVLRYDTYGNNGPRALVQAFGK